MKVTKVTCFPVATASAKVKANGSVVLEEAVELKYILMQGPKDMFVSWAGGKKYTKKDGTAGWDSPIYIKDEATLKSITEQVLAKFKSVSGGSRGTTTSASAQSNDSSFAADDIPF